MRITPSANRNSYRVAKPFIYIPRVEALRPSTLGYEIATLSELPGVRTSCFTKKEMDNYGPSLTLPKRRENQSNTG